MTEPEKHDHTQDGEADDEGHREAFNIECHDQEGEEESSACSACKATDEQIVPVISHQNKKNGEFHEVRMPAKEAVTAFAETAEMSLSFGRLKGRTMASEYNSSAGR